MTMLIMSANKGECQMEKHKFIQRQQWPRDTIAHSVCVVSDCCCSLHLYNVV